MELKLNKSNTLIQREVLCRKIEGRIVSPKLPQDTVISRIDGAVSIAFVERQVNEWQRTVKETHGMPYTVVLPSVTYQNICSFFTSLESYLLGILRLDSCELLKHTCSILEKAGQVHDDLPTADKLVIEETYFVSRAFGPMRAEYVLRVCLLTRNFRFVCKGYAPPVEVRRLDGAATFDGRRELGVFATRPVKKGELLTQIPVDVVGVTTDTYTDVKSVFRFFIPPNNALVPEERGSLKRSEDEATSFIESCRQHVLIVDPPFRQCKDNCRIMIMSDPSVHPPNACGHMCNDGCFFPEEALHYTYLSTAHSNAASVWVAGVSPWLVALRDIGEGEQVFQSLGLHYWAEFYDKDNVSWRAVSKVRVPRPE